MAKIVLNVELQAKNATTEINKLITSIKSIGTELNKIQPNKDLTAQLNALARALNSVSTNTKKVADSKKSEAQISLKQAQTLKAEAQAREADAKAAKAQAEANKTVTDSVQKQDESFKNLITTQLKHQVIQRASAAILNVLASAWNSLNDTLVETEKTVVAIQRVLDEDIPAKKISDDLFQIAQEYGATMENVSLISQKFAQTGLSWNDTIDATRAAVLAMNVAELDATEATDGLIAILTQFKYEASDLYTVIDQLNKVGDKFPVTSQKILAALQRTGASAQSIGRLDLSETIGIITAMSESTGRSGENLGTALNSLINYSSKDSALDIFSDVSDSVAEVVDEYKKGAANILDVWTALGSELSTMTDQQIDILQQYFESDEGSALMQELGSSLEMTQEEIEAVYGTANTFRKSYFVALLENIATASEAAEVANNAEGYSQKENLKYLNTYEAKVNQLKAQWQELANDEQGLLAIKKDLIDIASTALKIVDFAGGLKPTLTTILGLVVGVRTAFKFNEVRQNIDNIIKSLSIFKSSLKGTATAANTAATSVEATGAAVSTTATAITSAISVIGLFIAALSLVTGIISEQIEKQKEAKQEIIDTGIAAVDQIAELKNLKAELQATTAGTEEFDEVSNKLVETLGLTSAAFSSAKDDAEAYKNELLELTQTQLLVKKGEVQASIDAAMEKYKEEATSAFYPGSGALMSTPSWFIPGVIDLSTLQMSDPQKALESYQNIINKYEELMKNYNSETDYETQEKYSEFFSSEVGQALAELQKLFYQEEDIQDLIEGTTNETNTWGTALLDVKSKFSDILNNTGEINEELNYQNKVLEAQKALTEAIAQARKDYLNSVLDEYLDALEDETKYEEYLLKIEEERRDLVIERVQAYIDGLEEETTLQERLLAVEEARKALEDAKNQRNVRIYNSRTGNWEWRADRNAVEDAQNNLNEAETALDDYLKSQAWEEIQNSIKDGSANEGLIRQILDKWLSLSGSGELNSWGNGLVHEINDATKEAANTTTSSVESLQDYLKNEAIAEIRELIDSGNITSGGIKNILDKYLRKTGGDALFEWADNLNKAMSAAVNSGYYDRSQVQTQVQAVNTAQENLQAYLAMKVIDDIMKAAGDGKPTQEMIDNAINNSGLSPSMQNNVKELVTSALSNVPETQTPSPGKLSPYDLTQYNNYDRILITFQDLANLLQSYPVTNSLRDHISERFGNTDAFTDDGTKRNILLTPEEFKSKGWEQYEGYDDYVVQMLSKYKNETTSSEMQEAITDLISGFEEYKPFATYDNGGLLYGMGGIKATNSAEAVLGPELTKKMLEPVTTAQYKAAVENLGFIFNHPNEMKTTTELMKDVIFLNRGSGTNQNIGTQYTINGMQISKEVAEKYTVAELLSNAAFLSN